MDKQFWSLAEGPAALKRGRERCSQRKAGTDSPITGFQTDGNGIGSAFAVAVERHEFRRECAAFFSSTVARAGSIAGRSCPSECMCTNKLLHVDTKSPRRRQYPTRVNFLTATGSGLVILPRNNLKCRGGGSHAAYRSRLEGTSLNARPAPFAIPPLTRGPPARSTTPLSLLYGTLMQQRARYLLPIVRPFDRSTSFGGVRGPRRGRSESTS
jgi:hypothetical protein